jgi:hypothetical protein
MGQLTIIDADRRRHLVLQNAAPHPADVRSIR